MPRKPRFFLPNVPVHAIVRGNSRNVIFAEDSDRKNYLEFAKEASEQHKVNIHAYVLMDNHVHWLMSSEVPENISKFMQYIGRRYVPYFNRKYDKSGTLWEGRFKASLVNSDKYLLSCYRYIELNPIRSGMVNHAEAWHWSSYRCNALEEQNNLITPHENYYGLGRNSKQRAKHYQESFKELIDSSLINDIRDSVQTGTPLGNEKFKEQIEKLLGLKVGHSHRGRPKKAKNS